MELITSKENKTLKYAQSLQRKKYRKQYGEYLAEGLRTVDDMVPTGLVSTIFISDCHNETSDAYAVAMKAAHMGAMVYQVKDSVLKSLESTVHGQGLIGIVKKQEYKLTDATFDAGLYILLDAVQDPGNLGTIIRTAVAAGANGLFLTKGSVDPYNEKTVRSTMSAITKLPIYENVAVETVLPLLQANNVSVYATALDEAKPIQNVDFAPATLLLLGNEANGLSDPWFDIAHERITIPMYGPIESLNLAVASALCMYAVRESWLKNE